MFEIKKFYVIVFLYVCLIFYLKDLKMIINSINAGVSNRQNFLSTSKSPNFTGSLNMKGVWPFGVDQVFFNNALLKKALKTHSITAELKEKPELMCRSVNGKHKPFAVSRTVYRLKMSAKKDSPTLWDKIKYAMGFKPKTYMSKHYHSAYTTGLYVETRLGEVLDRLTK